MHTEGSTPRSAAVLRELCAAAASTFGSRLLARAEGNLVTFRAFVITAREMVAAYPEQTATYLAVLVALDMQMRAEQACGDARPSAN
jgi:hypothetical protein